MSDSSSDQVVEMLATLIDEKLGPIYGAIGAMDKRIGSPAGVEFALKAMEHERPAPPTSRPAPPPVVKEAAAEPNLVDGKESHVIGSGNIVDENCVGVTLLNCQNVRCYSVSNMVLVGASDVLIDGR